MARRSWPAPSGARAADQYAPRPRQSNLDPNLAALSEAMQRGLKRKVRIVRARGRKPGRIEIEFYGVDDLSALAATLGAAARTHSAAS